MKSFYSSRAVSGAMQPPSGATRRPWVAVLLLAALSGALASSSAASSVPTPASPPAGAAKPVGKGITWVKTYEEALGQAKKERKLILIDFYTSWCGWCKRLDSDVFSQESFAQASAGIVPVKVDADQRRDLATKFNVSSYPRLFFLSSDGFVLETVRGYLNLQDFTAKVKSVKAGETEYRRLREAASNPDDLPAAFTFAQFLSENNQLEASITYWQQVHDNALRQLFSTPAGAAGAANYHRLSLLQLGRAYHAVGLADVARQNLGEVISAYPASGEAQQAQVLLAQVNTPAAAVNINPGSVKGKP